MTLQELANLPREYLKPAEVAEVLGTDAHALRLMAKQRPELLGFPATICGAPGGNYNRVKFPKRPFLRYMGLDV